MLDVISPHHLALLKTWLGSGSINIFGLPFAGKDTHGMVLADLFGATLLGGGEILRGSTIPDQLQKDLDAGLLFPQDKYMEIVTPYLKKKSFEAKPLILSSVGRWHGEEQGIIAACQASDHPIKAVIYLQLNEETVHRRWKKSQGRGDRGKRADDAEHVLETRLKEFREKTLPVIETYRKMGLLIEINSEASKHEVLESILARLLMLATNRA